MMKIQNQSGRLVRCIAVVMLSILITACGSRVELLTEISESEANEALAALLEAGIKAGKLPGKEGMVSLDVEQSQVARAVGIMRAEGLPRERYAKMGEVFRKEGLISSPLEERARYLWALSQELSATISQIDGVIKARVHVVLPEHSTGGDPALPSSAAVFIKHKAGTNLEDAVPQIKRLVSNSIPGLTADKVSVILLPSTIKSSEDSSAKPSALSGVLKANGTLRPELIWGLFALLVLVLIGLGLLAWRRWGKVAVSANTPASQTKAAMPAAPPAQPEAS
jgi:type III secretion protein J